MSTSWILQQHFKLRFAGVTFIDTPNLIVFKDEPIFTVKQRDSDGAIEIDFDIFDGRGKRVAAVRSGALTGSNQSAYESMWTDNQFVVRELKTGRAVCEIRRRADAKICDLDVSVQMYMPDGFLVHANPAQSNIGRQKTKGKVVKTSEAALKYS